MKFSFLMAVNRDNPYLDAAIKSVLNQTDPDFQFFIVANNCSDELWNYLNSFADARLRLFRTRIGQLSFNLNYGLNKIGTGYALRMDADDISIPERLALTKQALVENNYPDILAGSAMIIDQNSARTGTVTVPLAHDEIVRKLWYKNPIVHPACALRVESILKIRGYSGGFLSEDYELWIRAARADAIRFTGIASQLIEYRVHGDQARGQTLAYAEAAGVRVREFVLNRDIKFLFGALYSTSKYFYRSIVSSFVRKAS